MAYEALYRKARPMTFDEVRGQEVAVRSLRNQIQRDRISHAYLFTGIRGTGKTSVARIFARAINCENPDNGNPCNRCASCLSILKGTSDNVIEIDAAANGLIEDIRDMEDLAKRRPMRGSYRVFIIDETQEMRPAAVNAFLKTLEEPPSWVVFILATTSVKNMPETIMSRCQEYDFRRIDYDTVADQLKKVLAGEGLEAEEQALRRIAVLSEGSMRDALSLLDRAAAFQAGEKITFESIRISLHDAGVSGYTELFRCMIAEDAKGSLNAYDRISENVTDSGQFLSEVLWYLRSLVLIKSGEDGDFSAEEAESTVAEMKETAGLISWERIMEYIDIFSAYQKKVQYASVKTFLSEMARIAVIEALLPPLKERRLAWEKKLAVLESEMGG